MRADDDTTTLPALAGARLYPLAEHAIVLEISATETNDAAQRQIWRLAEALNAGQHSAKGLRDIVPGMNNLTLVFDPIQKPLYFWAATLAQCWQHIATTQAADVNAATPAGRCIDIPVIYGGDDGPDLAIVAEHHHLTPDQLIAAHSDAEYTVYFIGFQPGFAYLQGMNPALETPRKATPRLRVNAGSVGIGGRQTGIYPLASPGGWQIIGRRSPRQNEALFDAGRQPPSLLLPGDRVRFVPSDD